MSTIIPFPDRIATSPPAIPPGAREVPRPVALALGAILLSGGPVPLREICLRGDLHRTAALIEIESAGLFRTRRGLTGTRIDLDHPPDGIGMALRTAAVIAWASACGAMPGIE
ncbi:hypothetical protein ACSSV4_000626 [Roseovarius sp. MBR-154]|jgi:hypothetical protein